MSTLVDIQHVSKTYETRSGENIVAVENATMDVGQGEFVSLVGPSGCGKTTILKLVMGLISPTDGNLTLHLRESDDRPGVVFQDPTLLPWRTALENVLLPSEVGRRSGDAGPARGASKAALRDRATQLLDMVGLGKFSEKLPVELSGGMQQRVAIARALLLKSPLICLDEPFSALDEFTREQMNEQLLEIWASQGITCLFVTHNLFEAVFLSDRIAVMGTSPGHIVEVIDVPLSRPRDRSMLTSPDCVETVAKIRGLIGMDPDQIDAETVEAGGGQER